ncbi:uncharacterized protein LOC142317688 [Lycorma delicatula]|uniref:uncharacterized protein LOC142317688 n=1 Tax=Lycorma delicatula TaxID=130591 RepID=UPI003F51A3F3
MKNVYILDDNESNSNDRYSERKHALLMSESEWLKLGSYLEKGQKLLETAEEKIIKDERRKHLSKEMAKTWDNTVINLRRRRLEQRKERAKNLENDRRRRFLQARQEEEDLKKKVRDEAKATLSLQKDSSKKLTSTLRFSEV